MRFGTQLAKSVLCFSFALLLMCEQSYAATYYAEDLAGIKKAFQDKNKKIPDEIMQDHFKQIESYEKETGAQAIRQNEKMAGMDATKRVQDLWKNFDAAKGIMDKFGTTLGGFNSMFK